MTTPTCLYPIRHSVTGRFCSSVAAWVVIEGVSHTLCPRHIGVMRAQQSRRTKG